jgi:hypothetical protein
MSLNVSNIGRRDRQQRAGARHLAHLLEKRDRIEDVLDQVERCDNVERAYHAGVSPAICRSVAGV